MSSRRLAAAVLAVGAAAGALAGCGKKGDPEPPLRVIPRAAADLTAEQRGTQVILRFAYPRTTTAGAALPGIDRLEVFEVARPLPEPPATPPVTEPMGEVAEPEPGEPAAASPEAGETGTAEPEAGEPAAPEAREAEPGEHATAAPESVAAGVAEPAPGPVPIIEPGAAEPSPGGAPTIAEAELRNVAPPTAPPAVPAPLDAREFTATAKQVLALGAEEIAAVSSGDRLTLRLPVSIPERPEARWYAVRTAVEGETSGFSNQAVAVVEAPPAAPSGLELEARAEGVEVRWSAPPAAAGEPVAFQVYRRDATAREFDAPAATAQPGERQALDGGARFGQRYVYGVTAVGRLRPLVESAVAATAEIDYRDRFAPPPPTGLVALSEPGRVRLVWNASDAPDLAGYRVYRRRGEGGAWEPLDEQPLARPERIDQGLAPGDRVAYRVTALDQLGNESEPSEVAAAFVR